MIRWLLIFIISLEAQAQGVTPVKANAPQAFGHSDIPLEVRVEVEVMWGYHIQANRVKDESLVPTTLTWREENGWEVRENIFPPAKKFKLQGSDLPLEVYDGKFDINTVFVPSSTLRKGSHRLFGKLQYQACDSIKCLFPRSVEFFAVVELD
ncbi:protein-disulfide reductase DsbD family protein [Algoriphagus sp. C2-6-M1]|uniref:protein-disulfide reductase DsbD domain-containing protein n=1 Tax=Algoriphagus persicinus TaxID=3108754 RepID=UPI002B36BFE9|nr:protein-disulfide reductase DsbD domain-containing protein [Algoriphagus sp. C2-6-M1]MEB2779579.1 protein-disulfide reductase DsbD family protein [Algoriphagus sp. C2-6-M1]